MKASSMQNHFDVTRSKCRQTKPIMWATLPILMSLHANRSSSSLYLAELQSMQYGCKFANICNRKGYTYELAQAKNMPCIIQYTVLRDVYKIMTYVAVIYINDFSLNTVLHWMHLLLQVKESKFNPK